MAISNSDAAHLLRRSGFAATPGAIIELAGAADWPAAVDRVLDTTRATFAPMPPRLGDPKVANWDKWVEIMSWWIETMRTSSSPIVDKMALFFHAHHFVSGRSKNLDADLAWRQIDLFRRHALGDYHALAQAVAVDPWMLHYLDNGVNRAPDKLNENFGRELLELFTVGRGHHTQADVVAMTRAWSGHNLGPDKKSYQFNAAAHDEGTKVLFGISKNWNGPEALSEALLGARAVPASKLLVAKLWRYLVGTRPDDVVDALAAEFRASSLSLKSLVRAIFLRPEFRSAAARTAKVRSPIEWFVAVTKALDIPVHDSHPDWFLGTMGQAPLDPPHVGGWSHDDWLNSAQWWRRGDCIAYLRWVATNENRPYRRFPNLDAKASPRVVADTMFLAFGIVEPSAATRKTIEDFAAGLTGGWHGWSMKSSAIVLTALSPDFVVA